MADADATYTLAAWCFSGSDESSDDWMPQAVTSTQDAQQDSGYAAGCDEVVAIWRQPASSGNRGRCTSVPNDSGRSVGLRATFIQRPYTDGTHSAYRHVMLVAPTANGNVITPICDVHGGGAVWDGPYLFVARHGSGFMVFDTRRTYRIPYDTTCGANGGAPGVNDIGVIGGRVCAAGYRYVMVQVGQFSTTPASIMPTLRSRRRSTPGGALDRGIDGLT